MSAPESENQQDRLFYRYGRRKTDRLPGVLVKSDGRFYLKASYLEQLNRQARNLSMLMDSASSIMAEMGLDNLLVLIMDSVTRVMQADRSTLFLIDEQTREIWSRVAQGSDEIRIPLGKGIAGHVAHTGDTINIPDAYNDDRFNSDFDRKSGYKTRSILCMPVRNPQGDIIGAIQVLNKVDGTIFTAEDESLLAAFASLAGISLANARAYEELEKERDLLEVRVQERTRDLEEARQKSDELLLNILPEDVADELKINGHATPRSFAQVSVLFTDFKGFTSVAEKVSPEDLVKELDKCFYY
ncbi:MAG: GAF domain-containing protein, partial [Leptospiraceae bacterium]|nr:GAF domain-containing protein [Leptospiraceae bacterium]